MSNKTNQKSLDINAKEDIKQTEINAMEKVAISNSYHTGVIETNLFLLKALMTINGAAVLSILTFIGNQTFQYNEFWLRISIAVFIIGVGLSVFAGGVLSKMYYDMKSKHEWYHNKDKVKNKSEQAKKGNSNFITLIGSSFVAFLIASIIATCSISFEEKKIAKPIQKYEQTIIHISH